MIVMAFSSYILKNYYLNNAIISVIPFTGLLPGPIIGYSRASA